MAAFVSGALCNWPGKFNWLATMFANGQEHFACKWWLLAQTHIRVLGNEFKLLPEVNGGRAAALCMQSACGTRGEPAE
jgi:hypothetical protein